MNKIKEQVAAIVAFNATELTTLNQEYNAIAKRIEEGIAKMKISNLYVNKEIQEIQSYAHGLLCKKYKEAKDDIITTKKSEFQF